jgi:hypothetical protein
VNRRSASLLPRAHAARRTHRAWLPWALSLLALAGGALYSAKAHAMTPLDETQLAQVRGQDGSVTLRTQTNRPALPPGLNTLFGLFSPETLHVTLLDKKGFEAALAAQGLQPFDASFYNGGPVTQVAVESPPVNASFELGQLVAGSVGLNYQGPSMGTIQINKLDARGTTLWMWSH